MEPGEALPVLPERPGIQKSKSVVDFNVRQVRGALNAEAQALQAIHVYLFRCIKDLEVERTCLQSLQSEINGGVHVSPERLALGATAHHQPDDAATRFLERLMPAGMDGEACQDALTNNSDAPLPLVLPEALLGSDDVQPITSTRRKKRTAAPKPRATAAGARSKAPAKRHKASRASQRAATKAAGAGAKPDIASTLGDAELFSQLDAAWSIIGQEWDDTAGEGMPVQHSSDDEGEAGEGHLDTTSSLRQAVGQCLGDSERAEAIGVPRGALWSSDFRAAEPSMRQRCASHKPVHAAAADSAEGGKQLPAAPSQGSQEEGMAEEDAAVFAAMADILDL